MIPARGSAILCVGLLIAQRPYAIAQQAQPDGTPPAQSETRLSPGQLDSLVAPVALYPDPILSQVLVASTNPVEIVEAARWLGENSHLQGRALADAAAEQPWDASVQALVLFPEVLNRLNREVRWTTDLGDAFLAQEEDVMDAIQRMRQRANANGALRSTPQQTVSTTTENNQPFIVIEPASPEIVYVPMYNPVAVWGAPVYPFPAISYPPSAGIAAASAVSFGVGMAVGSVWGGGWRGWGWNPGWGRRNIIVNNNFIRSNRLNRVNVGADNRWVRGPGRRGERNASNRVNNIGSRNRSSRPNVEQTRRRLNEAGQRQRGAGRPSQRGSAARTTRGGLAEGQRARRGSGGQGSANRTRQGRPSQGRQNRAGNRGGAMSSANRNRGSANRSAVGPRGGGGRARGGASRARGGGGRARGGASRARGGGGRARGGASRARGGGGGARRGGGRRR